MINKQIKVTISDAVQFNYIETDLLFCVLDKHNFNNTGNFQLAEMYRLLGHLENSKLEDYPELKAKCKFMFKYVISGIQQKVEILITRVKNSPKSNVKICFN